ncbi:MAG: type 1 glutamine amidotransferase [Inhella sp.]
MAVPGNRGSDLSGTPRIGLLQQHAAEGPGRLASWARRRGFQLEIHRAEALFAAGPLDLQAQGWQALILLGGPWMLDRAPAWLRAEQQSLRAWLQADLPCLGICLGAQLMASALGAPIRALPEPEQGWTQVELADGQSLAALQWHEQGFAAPPPGCHSLGRSAAWPCQGFARGRHQRALQFHPEWDGHSLRALHRGFGADCPLPREAAGQRQRRVAGWFYPWLDDWRSTWP